jgi:TonB family protein
MAVNSIERRTFSRWIVVAVFFYQVVVAAPPLRSQQLRWESQRKALQTTPPPYPEIAKRLKLRGTVRVAAKVEPDGRVSSAQVIGGHPLLAHAALYAVQKWRYETAVHQTTEIAVVQFTQ